MEGRKEVALAFSFFSPGCWDCGWSVGSRLGSAVCFLLDTHPWSNFLSLPELRFCVTVVIRLDDAYLHQRRQHVAKCFVDCPVLSGCEMCSFVMGGVHLMTPGHGRGIPEGWRGVSGKVLI